jgi:chromosome condensin MukBEF ATPase and DNA-binding subunit MukB
MDRKALLKEMKDSVGTQDPIVFFAKMVDVFNLLFDRLEELEQNVAETKVNAALAIHWEPKVARSMITEQINILRENKETYVEEISSLKKAFIEDRVTQNYTEFCVFWESTLGFHPFLDYR